MSEGTPSEKQDDKLQTIVDLLKLIYNDMGEIKGILMTLPRYKYEGE